MAWHNLAVKGSSATEMSKTNSQGYVMNHTMISSLACGRNHRIRMRIDYLVSSWANSQVIGGRPSSVLDLALFSIRT